MKSNVILLFSILISLLHCRTTEEAQDLGYDYFPLQSGKYWVFAVDSIVYNDFGSKADTFSYQELNEIDTVFSDQSGEDCYRIQHYYRKDTSSSWKYFKTSCFQRNEQLAQQIYFNKRLVKLNFPVYLYNNWDVNSFNTDNEELAFITALDVNISLLGKTYNECIIIDITDEEDLIFKRYEEEKYARGIGLIERTFIDTETQDDKTKGISYHKQLLKTNWGD